MALDRPSARDSASSPKPDPTPETTASGTVTTNRFPSCSTVTPATLSRALMPTATAAATFSNVFSSSRSTEMASPLNVVACPSPSTSRSAADDGVVSEDKTRLRHRGPRADHEVLRMLLPPEVDRPRRPHRRRRRIRVHLRSVGIHRRRPDTGSPRLVGLRRRHLVQKQRPPEDTADETALHERRTNSDDITKSLRHTDLPDLQTKR